jgi:hypothetical protein
MKTRRIGSGLYLSATVAFVYCEVNALRGFSRWCESSWIERAFA